MSFVSVKLGMENIWGILLLSLLFLQCLSQELPPGLPLQYGNAPAGQPVKPGTTLRILPVGDSITVGHLSSDGNGYREKLKNDLSGRKYDSQFNASDFSRNALFER